MNSSDRDAARGAFAGSVRDALESLPADLRAAISNVEVVIEDEPPPGQRLLGLYRGIPLTRRSSAYTGVLPDKISIYRGPIERLRGSDRSDSKTRSGTSSSTRSRTTSGSATNGCSNSTAIEDD